MNWKIAHAKYACSLCPINIVKHNCKSNKRNQSKTLHCEGYLYTNSVVYHPKNESIFSFEALNISMYYTIYRVAMVPLKHEIGII